MTIDIHKMHRFLTFVLINYHYIYIIIQRIKKMREIIYKFRQFQNENSKNKSPLITTMKSEM